MKTSLSLRGLLKGIPYLPGLIVGLVFVANATASTFQFGGVFAMDDGADAVFIKIANTAAMVDLRTTSFVSGGFAPVLTVFSMTGQDGGPGDIVGTGTEGVVGACGPRGTDPISGYCLDAWVNITLDPGLYLAVITQDSNVPAGTNWADGYTHPFADLISPIATPWYGVFNYAGDRNYTALTIYGENYPGNESFLLFDGTRQSGQWSLVVSADSNMDAYAAPEPRSASWAGVLAIIGLCLYSIGRRRHCKIDCQ